MAVLPPIHMGSALEKMLDKNKGDANERICLQKLRRPAAVSKL